MLATELRKMGYDVREEAWVDDLMEQTKDGLKEARMDLVVQTAGGTFYMDVVCFHPFTGTGKKRTYAAGGVPAAQEERKRRRYGTLSRTLAHIGAVPWQLSFRSHSRPMAYSVTRGAVPSQYWRLTR